MLNVFNFMYMSVLHACVYAPCVYLVPQRSEAGSASRQEVKGWDQSQVLWKSKNSLQHPTVLPFK